VSRGDGLARLRRALEDYGCTVRGTSAQCPGPDHKNGDRTRSLSIGQGDDDCAVLNCHLGCPTDTVLEMLGMSRADLYDEPRSGDNGSGFQVTAEYRYTDEHGQLLFVKERHVPKDFRIKRPDGRGGWAWGLGKDPRRVLYNLPAVLAAVAAGQPVYVAEGEKDAGAIGRAGAVATCNFEGAAKDGQRPKWRPEYGDVLKDATVIVVADKDDAGYAHAAAVKADLTGKAASVTVAEAAEGKDAADHLAAGHSLGDLKPVGQAPAEPAPPAVIRLDTVPRERVTWLWPGRLARGKLGIIDGDPGLGKSVITLDIAARVSTGSPMPGDTPTYVPDGLARGEVAGVLVTCAEDDIADTVIPRLASHGADLKRIGYIPLGRDSEGRLVPLSIPRDLGRIEAAIRELGAHLMVIDPITAYLPETVQTHNDASVRRALTPLADTAQRTGCAILLVRHLNKDTKGPAMYRGGGSIAFSGSARTALVTAQHPDDPKISVLARVKGNLSIAVASLAYRLTPDDENECPHVTWDGAVDIDADTLLRGKDKRLDAPARDEAADMVRQLLGEGPALASKVIRLVTQGAGCSPGTVQNAAKKVGVLKKRQQDRDGKTTGWLWRLPQVDTSVSGGSGYPGSPEPEDLWHGESSPGWPAGTIGEEAGQP